MGFYCENCGEEVKRNSGSCPSCGVKFKAVRCPACSYTDKAEFFKGGCPRCGYLAPREDRKGMSSEKTPVRKRRSLLDLVPSSALWAAGILLLLMLVLILNLLK